MLFIMMNANGLPGEVIGEVIGATIVSQAVIGENFGFDVNEIVLSVPEFTFEGQPGAETSYWIELSVTLELLSFCILGK